VLCVWLCVCLFFVLFVCFLCFVCVCVLFCFLGGTQAGLAGGEAAAVMHELQVRPLDFFLYFAPTFVDIL
jgi:hypothetical protein